MKGFYLLPVKLRRILKATIIPCPCRGPWMDLDLAIRQGRLLARSRIGDVGAWTNPAE
jgi:hypothetical protein